MLSVILTSVTMLSFRFSLFSCVIMPSVVLPSVVALRQLRHPVRYRVPRGHPNNLFFVQIERIIKKIIEIFFSVTTFLMKCQQKVNQVIAGYYHDPMLRRLDEMFLIWNTEKKNSFCNHKLFSSCGKRAVELLSCWAVELLSSWAVELLSCWAVELLSCWAVEAI